MIYTIRIIISIIGIIDSIVTIQLMSLVKWRSMIDAPNATAEIEGKFESE